MKEPFKLIFFTQDDPFYVRCFFEEFFRIYPFPKEIMAVVIQNPMGKKSMAFKLGAALGAVLDRPESVKDLWQLREDALRASDRLASFLAGMAEQLPTTPPASETPGIAES